MGYRNYIYVVDKKKFNKCRKMSKEQLENEFGEEYDLEDGQIYVSEYDILKYCDSQEVYEIGKYMDWKKEIKPCLRKAFVDKEVNKLFNDEREFYIAKPEILNIMITHYKNRLIDYYNTLKPKENETELEKQERLDLLDFNIKNHITWFSYMDKVPQNKWKINESWLVEQEALNLVHAIQIFNPKKEMLLFIGY